MSKDRQVEAWRELHGQLDAGTRPRRRRRPNGRSVRALVLSSIGLALLVTPLAIADNGQPITLGKRNDATQETAIVANIGNNGQSTRQSNGTKGGRAAGYGCDNDGTAEINACANYVNRGVGPAAAFRTSGKVPFVIRDSNNGKVDNLNADLLDDKSSTDFVLKTEKAPDADQLDGVDGADVGRQFFVAANATAAGATVEDASHSDITATRTGVGTYTVDFGSRNVATCAYQATPATPGANNSAQAGGAAGDNTQVNVSIFDADAGTALDADFNLVAHC